MKNRDYKKFAPGEFYHIFNRGNGQQEIFHDDEDRKFFLARMRETLYPAEGRPVQRPGRYVRKSLPAGSFDLVCYCLMPNHFHLLIRQNSSTVISALIAKVCTGYGIYFNKKYEKVGNLLQAKFKAVHAESDSQLLWLSAYIHNNPLTAGLVTDLSNYPWSSYPDYASLRKGTLCNKDFILSMFKQQSDYEAFVKQAAIKTKELKDIKHLLLD